jgi:hypothetical protein
MKNIMILSILLVGCGEQTFFTDAGYSADVVITPDAGAVDAPYQNDAGVPDAPIYPDAWMALPDSGVDAFAAAPDAYVAIPDAQAPDAFVTPDAAAADSGPRRPRGRPVDITGNACGLDEDGAFWCWETGITVWFGDGFDSASGSCALRGSEVWCADTSTTTMRAVTDGAPLRLDSIAEYSDRAFGCGVGAAGVLCWTNGVVTVRDGSGANSVGVMAPGARDWALARRPALPLYFSTVNTQLFDINPTGVCRTDLGSPRTNCTRYGGSGATYLGLAAPNSILGFGQLCTPSSSEVGCFGGFTFSAPGLIDSAIFGSVVGGRSTWGVCVSGTDLRCYDSDGTYRVIPW